jgi:hypothetical protein
MIDEYLVLEPPDREEPEFLQEQLQDAAAGGFKWVGTVATANAGEFIVMKRQRKDSTKATD